MAYIKLRVLLVLMTAAVYLVSSFAEADTVTVRGLGDAGWDSGDTRAAGYLNNNNPPDNQLMRGRPRADNPTLLEDTLINERLSFGSPPIAAPVGPGALRFTTPENGDKATVDRRDFDVTLSDPDLGFNYAWLRVSDGSPTAAAPALKLIIDTSEPNPTDDTAADRGETVGDKILVYEPYLQSTTLDDTWTIESPDRSQGWWWLVNLTSTGSTLPATNEADLRTLADWSTTFDTSGLGLDANIVSVQIGIGSGNPGLDSFVDSFEFTSSPGTTQWNFGVPEPTTACLLALLGTALLRRKSR
jgi:hypothetical protein